MTVWTRQFTLADLDAIGEHSASENCGIRYTAIGENWIEATMPLDARTRDAAGALHPGALGILAETIGSVAASLCIDSAHRMCVGQILHINYLAPVMAGPVRAKASAIAIREDSHVWDIDMTDSRGSRVGAARLTMAVLDGQER